MTDPWISLPPATSHHQKRHRADSSRICSVAKSDRIDFKIPHPGGCPPRFYYETGYYSHTDAAACQGRPVRKHPGMEAAWRLRLREAGRFPPPLASPPRKYVHKSQLKAVIMQQKRLIPLCPLMLPLSTTSCHRSGDLQSSGLSTKKKFTCMTDRKTVQSGSRPDL